MQLSDARRGDRYKVTDPEHDTTYEAVIVQLDGQLWATVDYILIGVAAGLPSPWDTFKWEKK